MKHRCSERSQQVPRPGLVFVTALGHTEKYNKHSESLRLSVEAFGDRLKVLFFSKDDISFIKERNPVTANHRQE